MLKIIWILPSALSRVREEVIKHQLFLHVGVKILEKRQ
jgi:hypothetical protein